MEFKRPPAPVGLMAGVTAALVAGSLALGGSALARSIGSDGQDPTASAPVANNAPAMAEPEETVVPLPLPGVPDVEDHVESGTSSRQMVDDRTAPSAVRSLEAGCEEPVAVSAPANDLAQRVQGAEPGTCFVLQPGEYRFRDVEPKDHMTFLGTSRDEVVVRGDGGTENAFHGTATGVTIGRMQLLGFRGDGGAKPQEQAPIRGTSALWASDRGTMAVDWLIEDIEASDNTASGVFLGDGFTVRGSLFADNGVSGLGGSEIVGGLVEDNVIRGNGTNAAGGAYANGGGIKFTEAVAAGDDPVLIRNNEIYGNQTIGVWCDIACDGFHVIGNYIHDQESRAVMYELSSNAVIRENILVNANSWTDYRRDFNAGAITVGESSEVTVEDNYVEGAEAGIVVRQTKRPVNGSENFLHNYDNVNYRSEHIDVRNNQLVDVGSMGISMGATGHQIGPDLSTVVFTDNSYATPDQVQFWVDRDPLDFGGWQGAGRDEIRLPAPTERPTWAGGLGM